MADEAPDTVALYRPVGPEEFKLLEEAGFARWPPRLDWQPIFYPVANIDYAIEIAEKWNVPAKGTAWVIRFEVERSFMDRYELHQVGGRQHLEWWIPAEDLDQLNERIVGRLEVVWTFAERQEPMTIEDFIRNYSSSDRERVRFDWNGAPGPDLIDRNHDFRKAILAAVLVDPDRCPVDLLADLFTAETAYSKEAWGIDPRVRDVAKALLQRVGHAQVEVFVRGSRQGFDAHLACATVDINPELRAALVRHCEQMATTADTADTRRFWTGGVELLSGRSRPTD
jgi:hypothetical protein